MGKFAKLLRLWKVILWKLHLPLQGTYYSGGERSEAQHCWFSFSQVIVMIAIPAKKGRSGSWTSRYGKNLVCAHTIKYELKWASLLILLWLSVILKYFCFMWRLLRGFSSEQALVKVCLWVCPICMKTLWNWFSSDSASVAITREHYFFSVWHMSGLETSDNYAQDFNNTNATQSSSMEAGREGKENKKQEWNVCKYSYGITSWFFFSCLITVS